MKRDEVIDLFSTMEARHDALRSLVLKQRTHHDTLTTNVGRLAERVHQLELQPAKPGHFPGGTWISADAIEGRLRVLEASPADAAWSGRIQTRLDQLTTADKDLRAQDRALSTRLEQHSVRESEARITLTRKVDDLIASVVESQSTNKSNDRRLTHGIVSLQDNLRDTQAGYERRLRVLESSTPAAPPSTIPTQYETNRAHSRRLTALESDHASARVLAECVAAVGRVEKANTELIYRVSELEREKGILAGQINGLSADERRLSQANALLVDRVVELENPRSTPVYTPVQPFAPAAEYADSGVGMRSQQAATLANRLLPVIKAHGDLFGDGKFWGLALTLAHRVIDIQEGTT